MKTVIKYKKRRLYTNLIIGIAWGILFLVGLIFSESLSNLYFYFHILLSLIYVGQYFYEKYYHYLIIENDTIKKPGFFKTQTIKFSEITKIKKFAGDITIYSENSIIGIAKNIVESESWQKLDSILKQYDT